MFAERIVGRHNLPVLHNVGLKGFELWILFRCSAQIVLRCASPNLIGRFAQGA